ncbi:MAG: hypothetical protein WDN28_13115 [Chthoniobacter sp.]
MPQLVLAGGRVDVIGNANAPTSETSTFVVSNGMGIVNLLPNAAQPLTFTNSAAWSFTTGQTLFVVGANAQPGQTVQAGQAAYSWPTMNFSGTVNNTNGAKNKSIRPDIVMDPLVGDLAQTSTDIAFSTLDGVTNYMRPLAANEMETAANFATSGTTGAAINYSLGSTVALVNNQSANSIRLENGGGVTLARRRTSAGSTPVAAC